MSLYFENSRRKPHNICLGPGSRRSPPFYCWAACVPRRWRRQLVLPWCRGSGAGTERTASGRSLGLGSGMASLGVGLHLIRKRGAGRSAAVERRNLLTVCRWESLTLISPLMTGRMKQRLGLWRQICWVRLSWLHPDLKKKHDLISI